MKPTRDVFFAQARMIMGLVGLSLINGLGLNTIPLINGFWEERLHLPETTIGILITTQILVTSVVSILLSTRLHKLEPRKASVPASLVLLATNVAFAFVGDVPTLFALSVATGAAVGVFNAAAAGAIAATARPDRAYALASIVNTIAVAVLTVVIGIAAERAALVGLFFSQAAVVIVALALSQWSPSRDRGGDELRAPPFLSALVSPVVFSAVALQVGTLGIWAFTERIGHQVGFSTTEVSGLLAVTTLVGALGGVAAAVLARPGRELFWAISGVVAFGVASSFLASAAAKDTYITAMTAQAFTYVFSMPFVTAVAVRLDRSGGLAAAAQGWAMLIGSASPALAGYIVHLGSYADLAVLSLAGTAVSVAALAVTMRSPKMREGARGPLA